VLGFGKYNTTYLHHRELRAVVVVVQGTAASEVVPAPVVIHRLGDAVGVHPDRDAAGKQHGEPADVVELGFLVRLAELDVAVLRDGDVQQEHGPGVLFSEILRMGKGRGRERKVRKVLVRLGEPSQLGQEVRGGRPRKHETSDQIVLQE
jgi:hypothetical protein